MFDNSRDEHVVRECYDGKDVTAEGCDDGKVLSQRARRNVKIAAFALIVAAMLSFIFITNSVAAADCRSAIIESAELMNRAVTEAEKAREINAKVIEDKTVDGKIDSKEVNVALSENCEYTALIESIKDAKARIAALEKTINATAKDGNKAYEIYKAMKKAYEKYVVIYSNPNEFVKYPVYGGYKEQFDSFYQMLVRSVY